MRVLGGGWEVDREDLLQGLDQVFVEQPHQQQERYEKFGALRFD